MFIRTSVDPDTGDLEMELDAEGIDWMMLGLDQLRDSEPGTELSTPAVGEKDGSPVVGEHLLIRHAD